MAKDPVLPKGNGFTTGNEANIRGIKGGSRPHGENVPVRGQMTLGKAHCIGDRKGTFKGKASDLRKEQGSNRFTKNGTARLARADQAGGQHGQGHKAQTKGHASLSRGTFGKAPGKMNPQG